MKGVSETGSGSMLDRAAEAGSAAVGAVPKAAAALAEPARSYADDHPLVFAMALLTMLLGAALLVRGLRREL